MSLIEDIPEIWDKEKVIPNAIDSFYHISQVTCLSYHTIVVIHKIISTGAARKKLSAEENDSLGNDDTISPTRKTRMSPRRAQGGTSPISINFCETRRNRRSGEIDESNNASEDETHNETKVCQKILVLLNS